MFACIRHSFPGPVSSHFPRFTPLGNLHFIIGKTGKAQNVKCETFRITEINSNTFTTDERVNSAVLNLFGGVSFGLKYILKFYNAFYEYCFCTIDGTFNGRNLGDSMVVWMSLILEIILGSVENSSRNWLG